MALAVAPVGSFGSLAHRAGIYGLLAVVLVTALAFVPGFAAADNLSNVVTQSAALGLVAIGQTFVIAGGLIDLSVGQLLGLSVVLSCALAEGRSELLLPVFAAMVAMGVAVGVVHGTLVNRLRIEPLILTFGTLSILQGLIFATTDRSVGQAPAELVWLANGRLLGLPVAGRCCCSSRCSRTCCSGTPASACACSPPAAIRKARGVPASTSRGSACSPSCSRAWALRWPGS